MMLNPKVDIEHRKIINSIFKYESCDWVTMLTLSHTWRNFHYKKKSQAPEMAAKFQRKSTWRWKLHCWQPSQKLKHDGNPPREETSCL